MNGPERETEIVETGLVSNIQKYSLQDGPGIRTTVFLKGCPLDCWWCHNPEGRRSRPEVVVMENRCVRCGECVEACPELPGPLAAAKLPVVAETCRLCGECIDACATGARQMIGRQMTVREVMVEILADRIFYEQSGGGATFSGGEPMMQARFLEALLTACRERGIRSVLDTCGYAPEESFVRIAAMADLVMYDLKSFDEATHSRFTGVSNDLILSNLRALDRGHRNIWIRLPVIPGVNDQPRLLDELAAFLAPLANVRQINLLPYHKTGVAKFKRLGREYRLPDLDPPTPDQMESVARRLAAAGLGPKIKIGG